MDELHHWPWRDDDPTMPPNPHPEPARTIDMIAAALRFGHEQAPHFPNVASETITALILMWECERPHTKD